MANFNHKHVDFLLHMLSLAYEGYLISSRYANAPIEQHLINEGEIQMDFYTSVLDSITAELISIGMLHSFASTEVVGGVQCVIG